MFKKVISWIFFTVFAGILPIILRLIVCSMVKVKFTYPDICSEIYFFNVILAADGLKELQDIDSENKIKFALSNALVFTLIILSCMYGILLENTYRLTTLEYKPIYYISIISTLINIPISFMTRLLKGEN